MIKKCLLLCLLLFALGSVNAVDINYDLEQSDFDSGAVAINSPGEYYLTGNIASPNGIEIYSDDVTLDGHGYSLTVTNSHGIQSGLHDNITIKNVVLNVTTSSSDRYSISFTGIMNSKILNNTVISNGNYAIYYYGSENTTISANTITAGYDGIYIGSSSENTTISGNTITAESDGIYVIGSSIVTGNKITSEYGIDVNGKSMVTGNTINVYDIGIDCDGSNSEITGNTITTTYEEGWGIEIETNNCTVLENTIYSNYSMDLDGYNLTVANNTLTSGIYFDSGIWTSEVSANTINGKPIYFYKNEENIGEIPSDAGQIIIINCTNGQISNLNLDEKAEVIYITNSSGITVENCTINPAIIEDYYIYIENSENCEFTKNTFNVSKSNVVGGIWAEDVNNITISENRFDGIYVALEGDYFTNSSVFNNIFENISPVPLAFEGNCSETYVYLNDFLNCNWDEVEFETIVTFNSPTNVSYAYNGTVYSGIAGNYWSDYNETNATINDGIWSIPYTIMELVNDSYPLVEPANPETKEEPSNDGLIHLTQDDFTDNETGYIASESGTYVLDENITCAMGIGINASNITIDGNGFYLTGNVSEPGEYWEDTGIYALSGNFENITVKNVLITEWYYGIAVPLHWEDYEITNFSVINCTFLNNDWMGIGEMYVFGGEITNSTFKNSYYGVMLPYTENIIITGNEFSGNEYGLYAGGVNNWIYLNKFENNSQNIDFRSLSGNYFHSPVVKYEFNGKVYEGRVGNYYGEELGTSNAGIYDKPYGIEAMIRK